MSINEDLLHYIWKLKNFDYSNLKTTDNQQLSINSFGVHNHSDGPDFLNAQITLDDVIWTGSIEIHVNSSDWNAHGHHSDTNFENTILHVVYESDTEIRRLNGKPIPCLELKGRINSSLVELYQNFNTSLWIPCEALIQNTIEFSHIQAKERAITERLEKRWNHVNEYSQEIQNDWEETAYRLICRAFGLVHNAEAFLEIAKNIPFSVLKKNKSDTEVLESIYMGIAGLLDQRFEEEYPLRLQNHFMFYQKKYGLNKTNIALKHKAVRPNNFPEIALSQFIDLMKIDKIFSKLINSDLQTLDSLLSVKASPFWDNHFTFDKVSNHAIKSLGRSKKNIVIINAVVPILHFMSKKTGDDSFSKRAARFLENIPSESNSIISKWKGLGITSKTSYDSQALLELKKSYCDYKKCLSCPIGHEIMKEKKSSGLDR